MRVLVLDPDHSTRPTTEYLLRQDGHTVIWVDTGAAAMAAIEQARPDMMLFAPPVPDVGTLSFTREIAIRRDIPVIVLIRRDDVVDRVETLRHGADDVLARPFSFRELLARMDAVMRRYARAVRITPPNILRAGDLVINIPRREATLGGEPLLLTPTEFELLHLLASYQGEVVRRETILRQIWDYTPDSSDQILRVYIRQLREKLGDARPPYRRILNVRSQGYRLLIHDGVPAKPELIPT
jgi:DNA-binding response OmpR family regulator